MSINVCLKTLYDKEEVKQMTLKEYIAIRIRYLRRKKGLTQDKLSELAGLEIKHINKIENNAPNLEIETLEKIIRALDETYESFFEFRFPANTEELKELNDDLAKLPIGEQKEVIDALSLLVKKMINK